MAEHLWGTLADLLEKDLMDLTSGIGRKTKKALLK